MCLILLREQAVRMSTFKILFTFFWLHCVFVAVCMHFLVVASVDYGLLQGARGSHCSGFSCCRAQVPGCSGSSLSWLLFLQSTGSRVLGVLIAVASLVAEHSFQGAQASVVVAHTLSSCSAWAQLFHGMQDLPGPGIKPVSLCFGKWILTTRPLGQPRNTLP